jgi:hypothetical protein
MMTSVELKKLERLCNEFSALTNEHKQQTLNVARSLLSVQIPAALHRTQGEERQGRGGQGKASYGRR